MNNRDSVILLSLVVLSLIFIDPMNVAAFEPINSPWDTYYDLLALQGKVERPYLTIRQLSRNRWEAPGPGVDHPWSGNESPHREITSGEAWSIHGHGVELFGSFNTAYPSGGNDGAMWQGKGVNGRFSTGVTGILETGGHQFQATLLPEIWGAQNLGFELVDPAVINRGGLYGDPEYGSIVGGIDNPQRYGDQPILDSSAGESEVRYSYGVFTLGAGNQSRWLGPAKQFPLILSNNAGGYPFVDVGIYPWKTRYGTFEGSAWWGRLQTSDYFDVGDYRSSVFTSGLSLAYRPPFLEGLTIGVNRVLIASTADLDRSVFFTNLDLEFFDSGYGRDQAGQHGGITVDWTFPEVGFNAYFDWTRNDFSPDLRNITLIPEHSAAYTIGARQIISIRDSTSFFLLSGEMTQLAHTRDYEISTLGGGPTNFYGHGRVYSGYTHEGQVLGSWTGGGADAQYLSFDWYHRHGNIGVFVRRLSRNKDVIYMRGTIDVAGETRFLGGVQGDVLRLNVEAATGINLFLMLGSIGIDSNLTLANNLNRNYIKDNDVYNVYGSISLKYGF